MHKYTIEFRIEGATLDPKHVTEKLNLQPCQVRNAVPAESGKKSRKAMWAYDGISSLSTAKREWDSLEAGLMYTLEKIGPKKNEIKESFSEFDVYWWCGHFQQSFDGGPSFSAELLIKLADFGAPLFLDNYFSDTDA
jgi:hypothetical protein